VDSDLATAGDLFPKRAAISKQKQAVKRKSYETLRRKEIHDLRCEVKTLENKLEEAKYRAALDRVATTWGGAVRHQKNESHKAIVEGKDLREDELQFHRMCESIVRRLY
ncbi:unnamed protein product, partial [Aphanomyces euteiches]